MTVWEDEKVTLLAHLIGDGSFVKRQPLRYASIDEANLRAVTTAALHFGVVAVRDEYPAARCTTLRLRAPFPLTHGKRNPIAAWLDELGLFGLAQPREVRPRAGVLPAQEADLAVPPAPVGDRRLGHREQERSRRARLLRVDEPAAVDDVSRLLLRFGISCRIRRCGRAATATAGR